MRHLRAHNVALTSLALTAAIVGAAVALAGRHRAAARRPPVESVGINLGGAANAAFPTLTAAEQAGVAGAVAAAGIGWLRVDVPFATEEPQPGAYRWTVLDEVDAARRAHLDVLAVLDYPPSWARGAHGTPQPGPYAGFAAAAARVLSGRGVDHFEIGNEPNLARYWGAPVSGASYAAVLAACDTAIHRVEAHATVVSGGLAQTTTTGTVATAPATFLRAMYAAGAHDHFDAIADHPYTFPALPDDTRAGNAFATLDVLHEVMAAHGDGAKPVWVTEYGAPTGGPGAVTQAAQAAMLRDAFSFAASKPWVGPVFVFDWRDDAADGDFGILTSAGGRKPAYAAVAGAR